MAEVGAEGVGVVERDKEGYKDTTILGYYDITILGYWEDETERG